MSEPPIEERVAASPPGAVRLYLDAIRDTLRHDQELRHDGIERFFRTGSKAGIQPKHAKRLRLQLAKLDAATSAADMNLPGWRWHPLSGEFARHWAVCLDENYRLTFSFEGTDAVLVDYQDYH